MSNSSYRIGLSRGTFLATQLLLVVLLLIVADPISAFTSSRVLVVPPPQVPAVFFHRLLLLRAEEAEAAPWCCWSGWRRRVHSSSVLAWRRSAIAPGFEEEEERPPSPSRRLLSDSTAKEKEEALSLARSAGVRRFLGRGPQAVVREGCVLVAPQNEYHHYYRQAAIFIYEIGLDSDLDNNNKNNKEENYIIRGVILDHPTPFTWQEMMGGTSSLQDSALGENRLFRGGDRGGPDGIVLLHRRHHPKTAPDAEEIGCSGLYQGGWEAAVAAVQAGEAEVDDYKAFFNYCEFSETELESLLVDDDESGDSWASVEVDTDMVLNADWDRGDCWKRIRNAISQYMQQQQQG